MSLFSAAAFVPVPSQLHMAHELAGALQQSCRIRQRCAVKEPHVNVRSEYIDVAEGRISQTCNRTAVMQKLPDFVPAFSHHFKPLMRDGSQCTCTLFHPRIDGGIVLDSAVESQQFRFHRRGVLSATRWFQGATLFSYSMGSPNPSVWTPSWRRTSKFNPSPRPIFTRNTHEPRSLLLLPSLHKDVVRYGVPGIMNPDKEQQQGCCSHGKQRFAHV